MISPMVSAYLYRSGIVIEKARREGRSLNSIERSIIMAGRQMAAEKGMAQDNINACEMAGERDKEKVFKPISVRAVFAYYWDPVDGEPAVPEYLIRESNHPALPEMGNVRAETLLENGVSIPLTPTFSTWVRNGRKAVRK